MRTRHLDALFYRPSAASAVSTYTPPTLWPPQARSQYCGVNVNALVYYGSNFPFANILKSGGGWGPSNGSFPGTDAYGYPTSLSGGQTAGNAAGWAGSGYPVGQTFVLLWDGNGTMDFQSTDCTILTSTPGRITMRMNSNTGNLIPRILTTDPANWVKNVRLLWPGTEATYQSNPWNPAYLNIIAPFSVLRFMDVGGTNSSPLSEWVQRPKVGDASYSSAGGMPIEHMIDLCNRMKAHPWICIPHMASDDYVNQFAQLLKTNLDPSLKPRIEYSNEAWNSGFGQYTWMRAKSADLALDTPYGMPSKWYGKRAIECFKIMRGVYGADAGRLIRVLSGQCGWTQFLDDATSVPSTRGEFDAIAIAPYIESATLKDPANLPGSLNSTPDQVVDQMLVALRGEITTWVKDSAGLAKRLGVSLLGYESGPGNHCEYFYQQTQSVRDAMTAVIAAGYAHPRMSALMAEFYKIWTDAGGSGMNHFNDVGIWSQYGLWSLVQQVTQDPSASPTYKGLKDFISANP